MKKAPVGSKTGKTTAIGAMSRRPKRGLKARKATAHHAAHPGRAKMGLTAIGGMSLSPKAAQKPKKPKAPVKRKWSPGSEVACCAAEALGTLLGWGPDEVLDLYWRTADDPDAGATIPATLAVAGVPGYSLAAAAIAGECTAASDPLYESAAPYGLILGVELPGSHSITVTPDGRWWSWGEPFDPAGWPELVIEEAWAVLL